MGGCGHGWLPEVGMLSRSAGERRAGAWWQGVVPPEAQGGDSLLPGQEHTPQDASWWEMELQGQAQEQSTLTGWVNNFMGEAAQRENQDCQILCEACMIRSPRTLLPRDRLGQVRWARSLLDFAQLFDLLPLWGPILPST